MRGSDIRELYCRLRPLSQARVVVILPSPSLRLHACKLTWLALGGDPAARSRRVEQFTAL